MLQEECRESQDCELNALSPKDAYTVYEKLSISCRESKEHFNFLKFQYFTQVRQLQGICKTTHPPSFILSENPLRA